MRFKKFLMMGLMAVVFTQWCNVSAYTPHENGGNRVTASGAIATEGRTVAADHLPFGSKVIINGKEYVVEDRFGGGYTNRIDIFMENYHDAIQFGRRNVEVQVVKKK